jgi:hypothetical protein
MKKFKFEIMAKLADGTDVIFDGEFIVGTPVFILDSEGAKIAATDDVHELEGGQKFKTEGGVISEIMVEEVVEETPTEVATEEVVEETPVVEVAEDVSELESKVADLEKKIEDIAVMIEEFNQTFALKKEQKMAEITEGKTEKKEEKKNDVYATLNSFLSFNKK